MTDLAYEALRDAVNLAREEQVSSVKKLRARLLKRGHKLEHIQEALTRWCTYAVQSSS